jgi:hypothetical protein
MRDEIAERKATIEALNGYTFNPELSDLQRIFAATGGGSTFTWVGRGPWVSSTTYP